MEALAPPEEGDAATALTERRINARDAEATADLDNASEDSLSAFSSFSNLASSHNARALTFIHFPVLLQL